MTVALQGGSVASGVRFFLSWGEKTEKSKFLFAEKRLKCAGEGELEPKVGSRARATRVARIVGWFYSLIVLFSYKNI